MMTTQPPSRKRLSASALALAIAGLIPALAQGGTSTNQSSAATPGQNDGPGTTKNPVVTISASGSTAMRNFTTSAGITQLTPGQSITLNNGAISGSGAAQVQGPVFYSAPAVNNTQFQLGSSNVQTTSPDFWKQLSADPASTGPWPQSTAPIQQHSAMRFEWHEQGSVEGILELANDQIGPITTITNTNRNPSGGSGITTPGTPVWVNTNTWDGTAGKSAGDTRQGHLVGQFYSTPGATSGGITFNNFDGVGVNPNGGQNAVQLGISDVNARQGFSVAGTGSFNLTPGSAGYGKGNPALTSASSGINGVGVVGSRHSLEDQTVLNMAAGARNLRSGTSSASGDGGNFTAGPWNSAGTGNLNNTTIAISGTIFAANPGTGLERVNRSDAQWLQTTGRLQNGADFNVVARDVNSGTLNVASLNVGLDPSFAVGENDGAKGLTTETTIGPNIRFSNKTAGGGLLRPTVQNSRMAIGHLGLSDATGGASGTNNTVQGASRPIRGLDYSDTPTESGANYVRASASTIVDGSYRLFQNETYVTVKKPGAAFVGDTVAAWTARNDTVTGIQGDNSGNDVRDFRNNITQSVANFPNASVANPADALLANGFIIPQFMAVRKGLDGGPVTSNDTTSGGNYDASLSGTFLSADQYTKAFAVGGQIAGNSGAPGPTNAPALVTSGTSSFYGARAGTGQIAITGNNYLFGDFDRRAASVGIISGIGVRDFSDLDVARRAQIALENSGSNSMFTGDNTIATPALDANNSNAVSNATFSEIGFAPTRGDLIVMGDLNSDGKFDGEDLRLMARGTSLADSRTSGVLGGGSATGAANFADNVRSNSAVLRKNGALDQLHTGGLSASAIQKVAARALLTTADAATAIPAGATLLSTNADGTKLYTQDPTGVNAFNKFDVNRDGKVTRGDAQIVDYFVGKNYTSMSDQLDAVVKINATGIVTAFVDSSGNPLDAKDAANTTIARRPISLIDVELNDSKAITNNNTQDSTGTSDFALIRAALGSDLIDGDTNFDGVVNLVDLQTFAANFGNSADAWRLGDFNQDGVVNLVDLNLFGAQFGKSSTGPLLMSAADQAAFQSFYSIASVPEPGSFGVLAIGVVGLLARRKAKRETRAF